MLGHTWSTRYQHFLEFPASVPSSMNTIDIPGHPKQCHQRVYWPREEKRQTIEKVWGGILRNIGLKPELQYNVNIWKPPGRLVGGSQGRMSIC